MFTVYVLKSDSQNYHYIGHTKKLKHRLKAHNAVKVRLTKGHRPFTVIYTEEYRTKLKFTTREYYLKSPAGNI